MTRLFAKAALAGVAALAVFACGRDVIEEIDLQEAEPALCRTVVFHAQELETRALIGEPESGIYPTLWTSSDTEAKISLNCGSAVQADVTPSQDGRTSTLSATVDFTGVDGPYTFYAVSPSSAAFALSPSRRSWKVSIPCEQTPTATSVDEAGIILAASSEPFGTSAQIADVDLFFSHLTAYGRISLTNLDQLPSGAAIQGIELTATTPLVGDWYWACDESSQGEHTLLDYGASSTITINTSSVTDVWFACAPVDLTGQMMIIRVLTDQGILERYIEFENGTFQMTAGRTAVFSVNMSATAGADWIAGSGSGTGNASVTVSMNSFTAVSGYLNGDENVSYEATQGTAQTAPAVNSDEIRIYQNGGLLTISANNGKTITSVTIGSSMSTTVQVKIDNGSFGSNNSISANGTYSTGTISASTVVFKCTGTSKTTRLYLNSLSVTYEGTGSPAASGPDPLLQETEYGFYQGSGNGWTLNPGSEQVTRSYNASGVQTYTLIDPAEVEELEIIGYKKSYLKGESFTVSVHWRKGTSTLLSESYTVTLVKEAGPKVWLSAGNGVGFIIKK